MRMLAARLPLHLLIAAALHALLPAPAVGGAALTGAALLERASKLVPAAQLAPDALLWSPALPRARFYEEHWERRWALLKGADRAAAGLPTHADLLPLDAATLRGVIAAMDAGTAAKMVKTSQASAPAACASDGAACVVRAAVEGATLIFDGGEYMLPSLHALIRAWKADWGVYIGANFYLTPVGEQAFGYHSDHTDVWVLQLEGAKQWEVCGRVHPDLNQANFGTVAHIFPQTPDRADLPEAQRRLLAGCEAVRLERGDSLYLPAGVVHRAQATAGAESLHISVSVSRTHHKHSWAALLASLLGAAAGTAVGADRDFLYFIHSAAAAGKTDSLLAAPVAFSSSALPAADMAAPWAWNRFARSADPKHDLPAGWHDALRAEFAVRVRPGRSSARGVSHGKSVFVRRFCMGAQGP
jgi:hypothetical protein